MMNSSASDSSKINMNFDRGTRIKNRPSIVEKKLSKKKRAIYRNLTKEVFSLNEDKKKKSKL